MSRVIDDEYIQLMEYYNGWISLILYIEGEKDKVYNGRWDNDNYKKRSILVMGSNIYEPYIKKYLLMHISKDRSIVICYDLIKKLKKLYGSKYTIYTIYTD